MEIYNQIWSAALKIIEIRLHSKKELKEKLLSKFPEEFESVDQVIEEMERVYLLNDQRFAEAFVSHLTEKNIGRLKLMHETRQKGLAEALVESILLQKNWSESDVAKRTISEKERVLGELDDRKKREKLARFLRNRGFSERVIYGCLNGE